MIDATERDKPITIDRSWLGAAVSTWSNPTVGLMVLALVVMSGGVLSYLTGHLGLPAAMLLSTLACYVSFTVMHDAVHGVAHPRKWVNGLLGRLAAFLLFSPYRAFRGIHLEHHSHTNDPERDPDFGVSRKPRVLLPVYCVALSYEYRRHFYGRPLWRAKGELVEVLAGEVLFIVLLVSALASPQVRGPFLLLWLVPALLAATFLAFAFDFLPHHPHAGRGRYKDTRAYPGKLLEIVLLAQNYHLVHHLWTTIPWYRYGRAFDGVRPELEARDCRIEDLFGKAESPDVSDG